MLLSSGDCEYIVRNPTFFRLEEFLLPPLSHFFSVISVSRFVDFKKPFALGKLVVSLHADFQGHAWIS